MKKNLEGHSYESGGGGVFKKKRNENMDCNKEKILAELILRVRFGTASAEERRRLEEWLSESGKHRALYERIASGRALAEDVKMRAEVEKNVDLTEVTAQVRGRLRARRMRCLRVWGWRIGAACVVGVVTSLLLWTRMEVVVDDGVRMVAQESGRPLGDKVVLVLADGKEVGLTTSGKDSIRVGSRVIVREKEWLTYERRKEEMSEKIPQVEEWNRIVTSAGGEYALVLSDGTRVWLNAETELDFPVEFLGNERVVRLAGEAYFEVRRDENRPFIVEAGGVRTRVLGTSFDVKAYANEESVSTTLVTGKVEVRAGNGEPVVLTPAMRSVWRPADGKMRVERVSVDKVMAWRDGLFLFDKESLVDVARVLERWYGVEFRYGQVKEADHVFSGSFSKSDSLREILDILTYTGGPRFRIADDIVYVEE